MSKEILELLECITEEAAKLNAGYEEEYVDEEYTCEDVLESILEECVELDEGFWSNLKDKVKGWFNRKKDGKTTPIKRRGGRPVGSKNKSTLRREGQKKRLEANAKRMADKAGQMSTPAVIELKGAKKRGRPVGSKNKKRIHGKEVVTIDRYPSKDKQSTNATTEATSKDVKAPTRSNGVKTETPKKGHRKSKTINVLQDKDKAKTAPKGGSTYATVGRMSQAASNVYSDRYNAFKASQAKDEAEGRKVWSDETSRLYKRYNRAYYGKKLPKQSIGSARKLKDAIKGETSKQGDVAYQAWDKIPKTKAGNIDYRNKTKVAAWRNASQRRFKAHSVESAFFDNPYNNPAKGQVTEACMQDIMSRVERILWQD